MSFTTSSAVTGPNYPVSLGILNSSPCSYPCSPKSASNIEANVIPTGLHRSYIRDPCNLPCPPYHSVTSALVTLAQIHPRPSSPVGLMVVCWWKKWTLTPLSLGIHGPIGTGSSPSVFNILIICFLCHLISASFWPFFFPQVSNHNSDITFPKETSWLPQVKRQIHANTSHKIYIQCHSNLELFFQECNTIRSVNKMP